MITIEISYDYWLTKKQRKTATIICLTLLLLDAVMMLAYYIT